MKETTKMTLWLTAVCFLATLAAFSFGYREGNRDCACRDRCNYGK